MTEALNLSCVLLSLFLLKHYAAVSNTCFPPAVDAPVLAADAAPVPDSVPVLAADPAPIIFLLLLLLLRLPLLLPQVHWPPPGG